MFKTIVSFSFNISFNREYTQDCRKSQMAAILKNKKKNNKKPLFLLFLKNPDVKHVFFFTRPKHKFENDSRWAFTHSIINVQHWICYCMVAQFCDIYEQIFENIFFVQIWQKLVLALGVLDCDQEVHKVNCTRSSARWGQAYACVHQGTPILRVAWLYWSLGVTTPTTLTNPTGSWYDILLGIVLTKSTPWIFAPL